MNTEPINGSYYRQTIIRSTNTHSPVIAWDFDGTIAGDYWDTQYWYTGGAGEPLPKTMDLIVPVLKALHRMGYRFILWTCRDGEDLEIAKVLLDRLGVLELFEAFNDNVPDLPFTTSRKICADFYVDDMAYNTSSRELFAVEIFWNIVKRSKPTEMYTAAQILDAEIKAFKEGYKDAGKKESHSKRTSHKDKVQRDKSRGGRGRGSRKVDHRKVQAEESGED